MILEFGTIYFWIFTAIILIVISIMINDEDAENKPSGKFALLLLLASLVVLFFAGCREHIISLLSFVRDNPFIILLIAFLYIAAGVAWSLFRWYFYVRTKRDNYIESVKDVKDRFKIRRDQVQKSSPKTLEKDLQYLDTAEYSELESLKRYSTVKAENNMALILMWMSWWPVSAVWTLIDDPIKRMFAEVFRHIKGVYQKMSDKMFEGI